MAKTIELRGTGFLKEREASAAITPGDLVEFPSTGLLRRHSTAGGQAQKSFALENDLIGKGIDDDYAAGDNVRYGVFRAGDEVNALILTGESTAIGDFLESAGNGKLQVASTPVEGSNVAIALVAVTGGGAPIRARVEVL